MSVLRFEGVSKRYGDNAVVVKALDLTVNDGEFMVLVGPSGCGKSTSLRMLAGLEEVSGGHIFIGERDVTEVPPAERGVAMVFQSYALYPHMTVAENMGFGLKMAGAPKAQIREKVAAVAKSLQLEPLLDRRPKALSGGQRQRVAIGRAIVREPEVILFDEPLSNLDASLRSEMRIELARLHERLGATIIYVTHDQVEAMTLGDRIAVFNQGRIEQVGAPMEVYQRPVNRFVAGFLGSPKINFLPASMMMNMALPAGAETVGVRPEHFSCWASADAPGLAAEIELLEHLGDTCLVYARIAGVAEAVCLKLGAEQGQALQRHAKVSLQVAAEHVLSFNAAGDTLWN